MIGGELDKRYYRIGLAFFCGLMLCIFFFFTAPDGVSYFHKFLGIFGIPEGIRLGNATLYAWMLFPLIGGIFCYRGAREFWRGYSERFKEFNFFLRYLPAFIVFALFLMSNMITPSLLDRAYFAMVSRHSGLRSVTVFSHNEQLFYEFDGNERIFVYRLSMYNHSRNVQTFNMRFIYEDFDGTREVYVKDYNGEKKTFALAPRRASHFRGEFATHQETSAESGRGWSQFSVVLVNENERHSPNLLVRRPVWLYGVLL